MRQESDCLDAGDNYAIGDIKSEDNSIESDHKSEFETSDSSKSQIQAFLPVLQPDSKKSQTIEIDSMLAEIDAMLAEI